jgi:DNA-binding beta-propeller fold protein YncE
VLRTLTLAAAAVLLVAGSAGARQAGGTPVAFVAVPERNEVVAVDLGEARIVGRVAVPRGPAAVAWFYDTWRGRPYVLVTSPPAGAVTLIDAISRRVVRVWRGLGTPRDVTVEALRAYVTDARGGRLLVLAPRTRRLVAQLRVGAGATAIAVSGVALVTRGDELALADVRRRRVDELSLPEPAADVTERPDTAEAYLTLPESGRLAKVDWGLRRVQLLDRIAAQPAGATFDVYAGDRLWVADGERGRIVLVSARDGRVLRRLGGCARANRIAQGGSAWIVASCSDGVAFWFVRDWKRRFVRLDGSAAGVDVAVLP